MECWDIALIAIQPGYPVFAQNIQNLVQRVLVIQRFL